jgi:hypothetical protein
MPLNRWFCPDLGAQAGSKFLEKTVFKKISQNLILWFLGFAVPTRNPRVKVGGGKCDSQPLSLVHPAPSIAEFKDSIFQSCHHVVTTLDNCSLGDSLKSTTPCVRKPMKWQCYSKDLRTSHYQDSKLVCWIIIIFNDFRYFAYEI